MSESGFVPLAPRRLRPLVDIDSAANPATVLEAPAVHETALEHVVVSGVTDHVLTPAGDTTEIGAMRPALPPEAALAPDELRAERVDVEIDAQRVRSAAIGLAAAACARALRYAVDRNPRLLARFVDDALRAAGSPQHAIIRLAPSAGLSACEPGDHDFVADASLSPGDVFVECADGTLGATIEQRAEGLVRAVSS